MRVRMALMVLAFGAGFAGVAFAADDPIQARRDIMRSNNEAAKTAFGMVMGQVPYDAAKAAAAMKALQDDMADVPDAVPGRQRQGQDAGLAGDLAEHGGLQGPCRQARRRRQGGGSGSA